MAQARDESLVGDGGLRIVKITEDMHEQALELYRNYFMRFENVSIATNLLGSQESIDEMEVLIGEILRDGISFAVRHPASGEMIAMCVNKLINPRANCTLDGVFASFKTPSMKCVEHYLQRMENTIDLFTEWQLDCALDIVFLSTRTDYERRGLAAALVRQTIAYARQMHDGTLPPDDTLAAHIRGMQPQAVCSVLTSRYSQRIGEKVGLRPVHQVSHRDFHFQGTAFADKIDEIHQFSIFAAMRL